jgi:hypothetical protein
MGLLDWQFHRLAGAKRPDYSVEQRCYSGTLRIRIARILSWQACVKIKKESRSCLHGGEGG